MQHQPSSVPQPAAPTTRRATGKAVEHAYDSIKAAILSREFQPGSHLGEAALAQRLGISRTPIREAFRRLGAEGWLEILPDLGVRVTEWSARDVDEVFEARMLLESHIARRAAERVTPEQIATLRRHAEHMESLLDEPVDAIVEERSAANNAFHDLLVQAAGSSRLQRILRLMVEIPVVKWTFKGYSADETRRSVAHHFEIIAALEARDGEWAASTMRSHILSARNAVLRRLAADTPTSAEN